MEALAPPTKGDPQGRRVTHSPEPMTVELQAVGGHSWTASGAETLVAPRGGDRRGGGWELA